LNIQAFLSKFLALPEAPVQLFAYGILGLTFLGGLAVLHKSEKLPFLNKFWILFYAVYFPLGLIANLVHDTEPHRLLFAFIPLIYFVSFSLLFGYDSREIRRVKVLLSYFLFATAIFTIVFDYFNISMDFSGIYEFELNRAGGVYGDANNSCLSAILAFVFIYFTFQPSTRIGKLIKIMGMLISLYAAILTFSKTGFFVLFLIGVVLLFLHSDWRKRVAVLLISPFALLFSIDFLISRNILNSEQLNRLGVIVDIVSFRTDNIDFSSRDVLLNNMLNYIMESPLIGNGIQFSNLIRGHNSIIGIWADAGVLAFVVFLLLLLAYFIKSFPLVNNDKFFSLCVQITLLVFMLTLQTVINQTYLMVVYALLGFVLATNYQIDDHQERVAELTN
jgi:O-antigen ligase